MRWALGVRDAAKTSCYEAERIRHGQQKWRWVAMKGICASETLTLQNHHLPHVTYKERPGLSLPLHPLCSRKRAQRVPGDPKSTAPAQEERLASRSAVHLSQARAWQAWQGRTAAFHTVKTAVWLLENETFVFMIIKSIPFSTSVQGLWNSPWRCFAIQTWHR